MAANANVEMKAASEVEKVNEDNKAVEEVISPNQDTFEALVEKANWAYKNQMPVFKLDTKTKLLKELLHLHTVTTGIFSRSIKLGGIGVVVTEMTSHIEDRGYKSGNRYWVNDKFWMIMNYPDIHQAIIEITTHTKIRFTSTQFSAGEFRGCRGYRVHYPTSNP